MSRVSKRFWIPGNMIFQKVQLPFSLILLLLLQKSLGEGQFTLESTSNNRSIDLDYDKSQSKAAPGRWLNSQSNTDCKRDTGPVVIQEGQHSNVSCSSYIVPVCEDGKFELSLWTVGGSHESTKNQCYDIRINDKTVERALYFDKLNSETCPRTEITLKLKVDKDQTELLHGKKQTFSIQQGQFSLEICFNKCGNHAGTLQIATVAMKRPGRAVGYEEPCEVKVPELDCTQYKGNDPTVCAKECPKDIFEDAPPCRSPGTYMANIDGEICQTKVDSRNNDCPTGSQEEGITDRGVKFKILPGCKLDGSSIIIEPVPNADPGCFSYLVPVCQDEKHTLTLWTTGESDATKPVECYDIKMNSVIVSKVLYLSYLKANTCPRTEVYVNLKVDKMQTELLIGKSQRVPLIDHKFSLDVCFQKCGDESNSIKIQTLAMVQQSIEGDLEKPCKIGKTKSNCQHYNGTISSQCWSHGCQYYLNGETRCDKGLMSCEPKSYSKCVCTHTFCKEVNAAAADCTPDRNVPIFENKLSCRRANTYYVYHPKQHCYSEKDSGDCTATVIHAVNFNGPALTDQRGIAYTAEKDSGYRDPNNLRLGVKQCQSIAGLNHRETVELYTTATVGNHIIGRKRILAQGQCVTYPVPICQVGEYMLTIKMTEGLIVNPTAKCTDVRINDVPIMIHLDPFILSGNKRCEAADAVVMFVAEGGDDNNPKSDRTLHLKGHAEPIRVTGGVMELQFCYAYYCYYNNFAVSAFSLERLGSGPNKCTYKLTG